MTRISTVIATAAIVLAATTSAFADGHSKVVGGAEMFPDKNKAIVQMGPMRLTVKLRDLEHARARAGLYQALGRLAQAALFDPLGRGDARQRT